MSESLALLFGAVAGVAGGLLWSRAATARRRTAERTEAQSELARRLNNLQSLQQLAFSLSESLDLDRVVHQVVKYVSRSIDADGVLLAVTDGGTPPLRVMSAVGSLADLAGRVIPESEAGLIGDAMGAEHLQVAHAEAGLTPHLVSGVAVGTAAIAPLRAHGITVGALATVRTEVTPFGSTDLTQLSTVATHAAVVLENARLFALVTSGKEQWETTFDALNDGVAVLDAGNRIRRSNRALAELLGRAIPAVVDADIVDVLTGDNPAVQRYLEAARSGEAHSPFRVRSDVLNRTLRLSAAPMRGAETGWLVTLIEDITEREAMEAHLIQSEKMSAVGQLVSGVAHELNNPLSSIAGVSDLLLARDSTPESDRPHLALIHEQAERASHIVRNLLTFARKGPAGRNDLDLNEIAGRAVSLMQHDLKLRQIALDLDLVPTLPNVRGDKHELQQIVLNLLTNAVQAVAENPPDSDRRIWLATSADAGFAVLSVADSGPGIPEDAVSQIFLPFFTTKAPGEGTGLGLSITYRLIESHGGTIAVRPRPGGGTEFLVRLPVASPADAAPPPAPPKATVPTGHLVGRILLAEEDPAVRRTLTDVLAADGHILTVASHADEAADLVRSGSYDVIALASWSTELLESMLREHPELRKNLLIITADVRSDTEEFLRSTGCSFLHKPIAVERLRSTVQELLAAG